MPDLARVLRRFTATSAVLALTAGVGAAAAQASYGEIGHFGAAGTGAGQFEASGEAAALGVNPKDNSVYVVDLPDVKNEFRIQKFTANSKSEYSPVASVMFKPHDSEGAEVPDVIEGIAVDPEKERVYVLAVELRPPGEKRIDPELGAASQLYAFSTTPSGETLVPAPGTPQSGTETGVLAGTKVLKPLSNVVGESLLEPSGIAVDPSNHSIVILAEEDNGKTEGEPIVTAQRVSETGTLGARWVDSSNYFEGEADSPAVTASGKVLVDNADEIDELPSNFTETVEPKPFVQFEPSLETLTEFPGEPPTEAGGSLSIGSEGTIYTRASIVHQEEGKKTGFSYPGVIAFSSAGVEEGWTGGQSVASGKGKCTISVGPVPQISAGSGHTVFVYDSNPAAPKIIEFGPGGGGCPTTIATAPVPSVNGVVVKEGEGIPRADKVALSSKLTQGNALSVEWNFGDGSAPQTVSTRQYQTTEVSHQFAESGELTVTEKIHTDDLETPLVEVHTKVDVLAPEPTAVTGEASSVEETKATLKGAVNPNAEKVTECKFEYGTTTGYGKTVACTPGTLGTGTSEVPVSAEITGLTAHTPYHFRLVAKSAGGTNDGTDATFATGPKPSAVTGSATSVGQNSASLNATVNPDGAVVSECKLEYGTSTGYGASTPCSALPGSGTSPVAVSAAVTGLNSGTGYHFRIVATTVSGTSYGADATFTTSSPPPPVEEKHEEPHEEAKTTTTTTTTTTTNTGPPPVKPVPVVTLTGSSASVSTSGSLTLKVSCPAGESSCSGTVTLKTLKAVVASVGHEAKSKAAILTLATASFSVAGGQVKTVTLHLSSKARALLARSHVLAARATLVAHDPSGSTHTTVVNVTLRPAKGTKH